MRIKKTPGELEVYAVAGTHTVVLSLDMKHKPKDLLGFAFERVETKSLKRIWLMGQKFFKSVINVVDFEKIKGQQYPTYLHPVQSFLWKDFTVSPGTEYTFIVTALSGDPKNPDHGIQEQITLTTEKDIKGKHGVFFNRGVSGSQSYAANFGNRRPDSMDPAERQRAYAWLSRGLYEAFLAFIAAAKPGQKLRGAMYEFHYEDALMAFKTAKNKGVDVNIVYDAVNYKQENEQAIADVAIKSLCPHFRDNEVTQAHNKFLVLVGSDDKALKVWTGSMNISEKGIFGHCNTGHIINDKTIANRYYQYWQELYKNPNRDDLRDAVENIQPDVASNDIAEGITVFFSPRKKDNMLQQYANMINSANEMVCCIYPFNIDQKFQTVFQVDQPFLRYILLDKRAAFNQFTNNDKDLEITAGAYIHQAIDQWAAETSAGQIIKPGVDFLHNKIIMMDPLSHSPTVITGSANYSHNSTTLNDENTLIIKGDRRVADIYFTEYVRLFDHFSFREWLNSKNQDFNPYLDETGWWINKYFDSPDFLSVKRKLVFKNMTDAVESP